MPKWEITVFGRVQGVGFRYFVWQSAQRLGINGFVKNLYDGSVYIIAEANGTVLENFKEILQSGSAYSRVSKLKYNIIDTATKYHGFEIK